MLSRTADSIYWMSRYMERADNVARFINVNIHLLLDLGLGRGHSRWEPLIYALSDQSLFLKYYNVANEENVIHFLTFDERNPNSIVSCIKSSRDNAKSVREVISSEMWKSINEMYHMVQKHRRKRSMTDLQSLYAHIRFTNLVLCGITENVISHNIEWHFFRLGTMIERAEKTARILDVKYFSLLPSLDYLNSPYDALEWGAVLQSVNAFEMYRKKYQQISYKDVANFLIFDDHFPRSMNYCVSHAIDSLNFINLSFKLNSLAQQESQVLLKIFQTKAVDIILENGLHEFISDYLNQLNGLDKMIYEMFFAPKVLTHSQSNRSNIFNKPSEHLFSDA